MHETKTSVLLVLIITFIYSVAPKFGNANPTVAGAVTEPVRTADFPITADIPQVKPRLRSIQSPSVLRLDARAILVKGPGSPEALYQENATSTLPIASLTKLMTALLAAERLPLDQIVEIKESDVQVPPIRVNFTPGEEVTVKDLLRAMLISSANDAAIALARTGGPGLPEFVTVMNQKANLLGMNDTYFMNPVGFDHDHHYSTAQDLGKLVEEFIKHPPLMEIVREKSAVVTSVDKRFRHRLTTTNKLLVHEEVVGLKTGYTKEALGNLIIFVDLPGGEEQNQYYGVILGSTARERDGEAVMHWVRENVEWQ